MCGILLNIGEEEIKPNHPALEIIKHRGPDNFGAISFNQEKFRVGLGHRRLSIIDLSERGSQPMSYDNSDFWITYNGEIYNYLEIRKTLSEKGYKFNSDSDTEVLLAAYVEWGSECLAKFIGMFAFSLYDKKRNSLFIARDRFGIKPLYYLNKKNSFRAASEIKQFISVPNFQPEVNRIKLYHFLNSGDFSFDEETLWKDVYELLPGHYLKLDLNKWLPGNEVKPVRWYEPPFTEELNISYEDAVCEFRKKLEDSVKFRLRADVPVGFLLSGGIDSSTLVGLAHLFPREKNAHMKTYSSCYPNTDIDESEFVKLMLEKTGADSCLHFPKPENVVQNIDKVIWHNDIPILHGSPTVHWLLYQKIKDENDSRKVIIEGQGGDEILCGYGDFYWAFLNEYLKIDTLPEFFHQIKVFQQYHGEPWKIILRKFLRLRFPACTKYPPNSLINTKFFLEGRGDKLPPIAVKREEPTVRELQRNRLTILRYILHNVDRNSMAHSRETRVPFLDHNLVEFCLKLPTSYKILEGHSKRILRDAVKDVVPEKILARVDKQGYSSPVSKWAKNGLKEFFRENLEKATQLPFVIDKVKTISGFEDFVAGRKAFDPIWWRFISTYRWMEIFKVKI